MPVGILGVGTALPAVSISQTESVGHAKEYGCQNEKQTRLLEQLYKRSSIQKRGSVLVSRNGEQIASHDFFPIPDNTSDYGPTTKERMDKYNLEAGNLAIAASHRALKNANIAADNITHLVTVSCTGFGAPGVDLQLIDSLKLSEHTYRTHVGFMGCHGAMNALRVAEGFCANSNATVLLNATEICSLHFQYGWNTNALIANSLFADGSATLVLTNKPGKIRYTKSVSYVVPDTNDAITWQIGDNGFEMSLSTQVPGLIKAHLPAFLNRWLKEQGLTVEQIRTWAVHPGGPRLLNAVEQCLSLPPEALEISRKVLADHGNMSSPTVLFILEHLLKASNASPCLMLGFGPGMTIEVALFSD